MAASLLGVKNGNCMQYERLDRSLVLVIHQQRAGIKGAGFVSQYVALCHAVIKRERSREREKKSDCTLEKSFIIHVV